MRKIFAEYKVLFVGGALMLIFLGLLLWPWGNNSQTGSKPIITNKAQLQIGGLQQKPGNITFSNTSFQIPETMAPLKPKNNFIGTKETEKLITILGMDKAKATVSNTSFSLFENETASLTLKFKERETDYQVKKLPTDNGKKGETAAALNKFTDIMKNLFPGQEYDEPKIKFYKNDLRAIESDGPSADFAEISANLLYKNFQLRNFAGMPAIKMQFNFQGDLLRLIADNAYDQTEEQKAQPLKTNAEILNSDPGEAVIFDVNGDNDYAYATGQKKITEVNLTDGYAAYVFDPATTTYIPFLITSGTIESGTTVTVGVPLTK